MKGAVEWDKFSHAILTSTGGNQILTKSSIEGEGQYYYGANAQDKKTAKPMIAIMYTDYELGILGMNSYQLPEFLDQTGVIPPNCVIGALGDFNTPRLFYGQSRYEEVNIPYFAKEVFYITVYTQSVSNPPLWDNSATLDAEWLDSTTARLSWDNALALADSGISSFNIYQKSGIDWIPFATVLDSQAGEYIVYLPMGSYTFRMTITDGLGRESANSISVDLAEVSLPEFEPKGIYEVEITPDPLKFDPPPINEPIPYVTVKNGVSGETEIKCTVTERKANGTKQTLIVCAVLTFRETILTGRISSRIY